MHIAAIIFFILVFNFEQGLVAKNLPAEINVITFLYPPYMLSEPDVQGRRGLELDILAVALKGSGVAPRYEVYPIPRSVFEFRKKATNLSNVVYVGTAAHFEKEIASGEYAAMKIGTANFVPYVNSDSPLANLNAISDEELKKRLVVVPRGSSIVDGLRKKNILFQEVSSFEQMFRMVAHKRVEVGVLIDLAGDDQLEKLPKVVSERVVKKPNIVYSIPLDIVIAQNTSQGKALTQFLRKRLKAMRTSGELKKVAEQYFKQRKMPDDFLREN